MPDEQQKIDIVRDGLAKALADPSIPVSLSPLLQEARTQLGFTRALLTQMEVMVRIAAARERQFAACREDLRRAADVIEPFATGIRLDLAGASRLVPVTAIEDAVNWYRDELARRSIEQARVDAALGRRVTEA